MIILPWFELPQWSNKPLYLGRFYMETLARVASVRHVTINKARKSSFGAPRYVILQSDWSNKNESYTLGTLVDASVCSRNDVMSPSNQNEVYNANESKTLTQGSM